MLIAISILVGLIALGAMVFFIQRVVQSQTASGFQGMQASLESMQRGIFLQQKEFENSYDQKNSQLRQELSEGMQSTRKELQQGLMQTSQLLESRVGAMDLKLDSRVKELTQNVGEKIERNLKEGFLHFDKIQEHLKRAETQLSGLNVVGQSINDLNNLLRMPHLRGSFGEALMEQLLNDMLPQGSYELQYRVIPSSTERVDAIIRYPNAVLPIDSKFPREQVLPLFETQDPEKLEAARKTLNDVMRSLARQIRDKYIHPEHGTTDMALMFVPSETLYFEVLRSPKLCDELGKLKVYLVSPNTLAITLHAISVARNYYEMAKGVEKTILEVKKAQQHYRNFETRFEDVGTSLQKAQNAFSMAGTHLSRYSSAVTRLTGAETPESLEPTPGPVPSVPAPLDQ